MRLRPSGLVSLAVTLPLFCVISTTAISADSYDAAAEFSASENPSGVWSYGWSSTLEGEMTPYDVGYLSAEGLDVWYGSSQGSNPSIVHNGTDTTIATSGNDLTWAPGQLSLHPGPSGQQSRVRFSVPTTGTWSIDAIFQSIDATGGSTDVHVIHNGLALFDEDVVGFGDSATYAGAGLSFTAGDTVDFVVGFLNGNYYDDSTALDAVLSLESSGCTPPTGLLPAVR